MLVHCARLERGKNITRQEFFAQVFDHNLTRSGFVGFLHDNFNVVALADVAHHCDHIVGIIFLQPGNDDGGIQASGVCEYDFLRHERS